MYVRTTSDDTGWTGAQFVSGSYVDLSELSNLYVRGPAPTGGLYYIACENIPVQTSAGIQAWTATLAPGYDTQAEAQSALDEFVKTEDAGGLTSP